MTRRSSTTSGTAAHQATNVAVGRRSLVGSAGSVGVAAPTSWTYRRRRARVLAGLVLVVFASTVLIGRAGAQAELADPVAGHVVVEPGDTLWDIAVATAPTGVDTRQQLASLRELNGIEGSHLDAWAVVLIPAR